MELTPEEKLLHETLTAKAQLGEIKQVLSDYDDEVHSPFEALLQIYYIWGTVDILEVHEHVLREQGLIQRSPE